MANISQALGYRGFFCRTGSSSAIMDVDMPGPSSRSYRISLGRLPI